MNLNKARTFMSLSKQNRILLARVIVAAALLALVADMVGALGGPRLFEASLRALIFYPLTYIVFAAFPTNRRTDLALIIIQFALGAELMRSFILNIKDPLIWPLETVSVMLAATPATIERLTYRARQEEVPPPHSAALTGRHPVKRR